MHAIIEYSHRAVGSLTGVLIIATVVVAWVVFRTRRPLVAWLATASLIGVVGEGALGGVVVAHDLAPWLVVVHLALAMMILGFLVATAVMAMPASPGIRDRSFRRLGALAVGATYLMLLSGSTIVASSADQSCHAWPLCGRYGFSLDFSGANAYTMLHRGAVLVIGALILYLIWVATRRWRTTPGLSRAATVTWALFTLQVVLGIGSARFDTAGFNAVHVALATLVWASVLTTVLIAVPRADRSRELSPRSVERIPA